MDNFPNITFDNLSDFFEKYKLNKIREYVFRYLIEFYNREIKDGNLKGISMLREISGLDFVPSSGEIFKIQNELADLGWISNLMFGDTVLFIYHDEKFAPKNQFDHHLESLL